MSASSPKENRYFFISLLCHGLILLFFIVSFDVLAPVAVFENTNQHDAISAVLLGDTAKSKLLPVKPVTPPQKPKLTVEKPKPLPPKPANPEIKSREVKRQAEQDAIALKLEKRKKQAEKDKALLDAMQKQLWKHNLLADIQKEKSRHKKKDQVKEKELASQFKKLFDEQSEKTLRESLLNETFKLQGTISRRAQGEVNRYKALIMQAISEQWMVPMQADRSQVTELSIRLATDGTVLDVTIVHSSGDVALDSSARAAVMKASPLPVPSDPASFEPFRKFILKAKPENVMNL